MRNLIKNAQSFCAVMYTPYFAFTHTAGELVQITAVTLFPKTLDSPALNIEVELIQRTW